MKKLLMTAIICALLAVSGCGETTIEDTQPVDVSRFVVIEGVAQWWVVADRETKVMYAVSRGGSNVGTFTLLVDADGNPLLWRGDAE